MDQPIHQVVGEDFGEDKLLVTLLGVGERFVGQLHELAAPLGVLECLDAILEVLEILLAQGQQSPAGPALLGDLLKAQHRRDVQFFGLEGVIAITAQS